MTRNAAARMEQILGKPPRVAPLAPEVLSDRERAPIERIKQITGYPPNTPVNPFFLTLARLPDFFAGFMQTGISAMSPGALPPRARELLILRTGWLCGAPYQFGEHVASAKRLGITGDDIDRIKQGAAAEGWSDDDRALIRAAEELHADAMISDETWATLAAKHDPSALIELTMIVGHYVTTAFLQNSLRFPLRPNNDGLTTR